MMIDDRFNSKIIKTGNCWEWISSLSNKGYGMFWLKGKCVSAHKFAYERTNGLIPQGLEIDHLCRNRKCVNPSHLEAVSHKENIRRGKSGINMRIKTHCPKGHPLSGDNLYYYVKTNTRHCRECYKISTNKYRHKTYITSN